MRRQAFEAWCCSAGLGVTKGTGGVGNAQRGRDGKLWGHPHLGPEHPHFQMYDRICDYETMSDIDPDPHAATDVSPRVNRLQRWAGLSRQTRDQTLEKR